MNLANTFLTLARIGTHFTWQPQMNKYIEECGEALAEHGRMGSRMTLQNRLAFIEEFVDQTIVGLELVLLMDKYFTRPHADRSHLRYAFRKFYDKLERTQLRIAEGYYDEAKR